MSFVSVVATKDYINVVGDGLVMHTTETGEMIRQQEDYEKFFKIAENQFIAFTGDKGILDFIKSTIPFNPNNYDLEEMANMLRTKSREVSFEEAAIMIAVGGLSKDNKKVEFYTISNRGDQFQYYCPKNDEIAYAFLVSSYIDDEKYKEIDRVFIKYLRLYGYNKSNKVLKSQKDINLIVTKIDPTVNNKTSSLAIRK